MALKTMFHISPLHPNDLEAADQVLMSAYQVPSQPVELGRLMRLPGTSWLAGRENDRLVGMVGAIDYGPFAYIGMMAVHKDFQRRGYGRAFNEAVQLDFKEPLEVLLPSPNLAGYELLQSAGFIQQRSLRHMGRGTTGSFRKLDQIYGQSSFMLG